MATFKGDFTNGKKSTPVAQGAEAQSIIAEVALTGHANGDLIQFCRLPAGHVPVDFILYADDLDSNGAPTITISVGVLNAAGTDLSTDAADGGALWLVNSNIAQASGMARPTTNAFLKVAADHANDRTVAAKITAGPATGQAGSLKLVMLYRAAP